MDAPAKKSFHSRSEHFHAGVNWGRSLARVQLPWVQSDSGRNPTLKRISLFLLLLLLAAAGPVRSLAQEGMTGAEYGRRTQIEAKKAAKQQRKLMKKAAKQQRKGMKKYLKAQRKAARKANHHVV